MDLYRKYKSSYRAAVPDFALHAALFAGSLYGIKTSWLFMLPLAVMQMRTFIVYHDCTHCSYVPNPLLNTLLGHFLGVLVFTPLLWGQRHSIHHKTNGNPENDYHFRFNEMVFHTTHDVRRMSPLHLLGFRASNHPFFLYPFLSILNFVVAQRGIYVVQKAMKGDRYPLSWFEVLFSTAVHDVGVFFFVAWLRQHGLFQAYALSFLGLAVASPCFFHTQHTFNPAYVVENETWKQKESGILGSSFLQVPFWLKYMTMGIEYHHIHHMNSKIPGYNLKKYHDESGLDSAPLCRLSMWDAYQNLWLRVYDPDQREYLTIQEAVERVKSN
jgi:omega-6 fatty acid desaturase (delta-12 desaturase)